jgi:hypothetical protein
MDRMLQGDSLGPGQSLDSQDGRYSLTVQADGNVVLSPTGGAVGWSSQTAGNPGAGLIMQADGNLVLYSPARVALWSSGTWGHPGAWVILQTDGNLVVYAAGGQSALWATNTWRKTKQVDGFVPSLSGLPFSNNYPAGTSWPIVNLPVVGNIVTADAGNGLCGGFGFTVVDMFLNVPRLELARDVPRPPEGSQRFDYLTQRLLDSFNGAVSYGTILKILDWIETPNNDNFLRHGLGHMMATDEWPNIQRDIDANRPSPIVLVGPPQSGIGDVSTIKQALANSHQVVVCGYDLGPADVTLHVYDPNNPSEDNATLTVSLAHPEQPVGTANMGREVRGLFRSHYTWHDPRPTWS